MSLMERDFRELTREHQALMRDYGRAQRRCSDQLRAQALTIEGLEAQAMQLRAAVIVRDNALAWSREDRAALERAIPGLPRRASLARRVEELLGRVQQLMRERLHWEADRRRARQQLLPPAVETAGSVDDPEGLEASLTAADLVICQTGCLTHGEYWRVQDHCKRTGKACVLVEQPDALRIVRVQPASSAPGSARVATLREAGETTSDGTRTRLDHRHGRCRLAWQQRTARA